MFTLDTITEGLRLKWDGQTILEYHFPAKGPRPYWHPLRLPDSPVLTMNQPADHIHHQGMWVAWKGVNGVNFWEQPKPGDDPTGYGRILHRKVVEQNVEAGRATFTTENTWVDWRGVQHLTETRRAVIHTPQDDYWSMDVHLRFAAPAQDVILDLKRGEPGQGGLFYSGLTVRFNNAMTPGQLLDAEGRTETMRIFGSTASWCGYAGTHEEDGQVYGMTILDHPENPRHPSPWWVRNGKNYSILQPSLCYHEPLHLAADGSLTLQYRVVIHRGDVEPALVEKLRF